MLFEFHVVRNIIEGLCLGRNLLETLLLKISSITSDQVTLVRDRILEFFRLV